MQILRMAWKGLPIVGEEREKVGAAWSAVGKYVGKEQMRAFVDEIGCEYEGLMDCAREDDGVVGESDSKTVSYFNKGGSGLLLLLLRQRPTTASGSVD